MRDMFLNEVELLYPEVEKMEKILLILMEKRGYPMRMVSGLRSLKSQKELFAIGRTEPGNIVTKRKISAHNLGLAVDNCFTGSNPYPKSGSEPWLVYIEEAKKIGFECGGDWHDFKDYPHIQMLCGYSLNALCDTLSINGISRVWEHIDEKFSRKRGAEWAARLTKVKERLNG